MSTKETKTGFTNAEAADKYGSSIRRIQQMVRDGTLMKDNPTTGKSKITKQSLDTAIKNRRSVGRPPGSKNKQKADK